jgi:ATP-dependent DNA helicase RecG
VLRSANDGFKIAEEDLRVRGAGDLLGVRQSGEATLRVADPTLHAPLLRLAVERPHVRPSLLGMAKIFAP